MKYLLALLLLFGAFGLANAARIHVAPTGAPQKSGQKWSRATSLHQALSVAVAGDEIWVRSGTYLTSEKNDRSISFSVPAGVRVFGGFAGNEKSLHQRPVGALSQLSGELGKKHDKSDNAYSVIVLLADGSLSTTLDGFAVSGGCARGFAKDFSRKNAGGGLYLFTNADNTTSHTIKNCLFEDNNAHSGAAAFIKGGNPVFTNCIFASNTADFHGGGVYSYGRNGRSTPTFLQCSFIDNASNAGAGLTNNGVNGEASPLIIGCKFIDNISLINAAAIFNIVEEDGHCEPVLEGCKFIGNKSILGDDVSKIGLGKTAVEAARPGNQGGTLRPFSATRR